jgi:hypothetical protein
MPSSRKPAPAAMMRFIVTNEQNPVLPLKTGGKLQVQAVQLVDPSLKPVKATTARLCGGTALCMALMSAEMPE